VGLGNVEGQPRVANCLSQALSRGRLAQAYLFTGPEGSGKRRLAAEFAKAVLCREAGPGVVGACGGCASCQAVDGGRHPDVALFQPEKGKTAYPVRQVREEIRRQAYLKPALGGKRFLIVDRAEALTRGAGGQNASADTLLKLLEEPPPDTIIILLASHPARLPDTVRSRCQQLRFDPPDSENLARQLVAEDGLDRDEALFAAHLAGGDLAVARGLLGVRKKDKPDLRAVRETLLEIVRSLPRRPYPELFALASALDAAARGWLALTGALGLLAALYRDASLKALRQEAGGEPGGVGGGVLTFRGGPEQAATDEAAAGSDAGRLRDAALRALAAQENSRRYPARLLLLEVLLIDLETLLSADRLGVPS